LCLLNDLYYTTNFLNNPYFLNKIIAVLLIKKYVKLVLYITVTPSPQFLKIQPQIKDIMQGRVLFYEREGKFVLKKLWNLDKEKSSQSLAQ
jgi:hypothetical protein